MSKHTILLNQHYFCFYSGLKDGQDNWCGHELATLHPAYSHIQNCLRHPSKLEMDGS